MIARCKIALNTREVEENDPFPAKEDEEEEEEDVVVVFTRRKRRLSVFVNP